MKSKSRLVTATKKDQSRNITGLCNSREVWRSVTVTEAIKQIEDNGKPYSEKSPYYTNYKGIEAALVVVEGAKGKFLRTDPDKTPKNNLDELPDC
jgi:hypothetical protein